MSQQQNPIPRSDEQGDVPFRSNRFFCVGNRWYFSTREGFDSGPYADKNRAQNSLERFISIINKLPPQLSPQH